MKNKITLPLFSKILAASLVFSISGKMNAQCCYTDNFSSSAGWTMNGTGYTIGPNSFNFNATPADAYNYATHPLNCSLSDTAWTGDIDFQYTGRGTGGVGHSLLALTAGNQDALNTGPTFAYSNQDGIQAYIVCPHFGAQTTDSIYAHSKKGSLVNTISLGIAVSMNTNYYIRLQRISPTQGTISLFLDAARTIHAPGSPQNFPIDPTVTGLNTVQHGVVAQGAADRTLTGTLAHLNVCNSNTNNHTPMHSVCATYTDGSGTHTVCCYNICSITVCAGTLINFCDNSYFSSGSMYWYFSANTPANTSPSVTNGYYPCNFGVTYTTAGTYTLQNQVIPGNPGAGQSPVFTVNVIPGPVPPTFTISPNPVCQGDQICFTKTDANTVTSYTWNINGVPYTCISCSTLCLASCDANLGFVVGTNTVTLTENTSCGLQTSSTTFTVNPMSPSYTAAAVCLGQPTVFTNTSSCPSPSDPAYTWSWDFGDANTSTAVSPSHIYANAGTYTVKLTVTDNCGDQVVYTSTVTVYSLPILPALAPTQVCAGSCVRIGFGGITGNIYSWTPALTVSCSTCPSTTVCPISTTTYTLTATDPHTHCSNSTTVTVTVDPLPGAYTGPSQTICVGQSVNLGSVFGNSNWNYSWLPGTGLNCTTCSGPTANPTSTTVYTLTVTDTTTGCSSHGTVTVTVNPYPPVPVITTAAANEYACSNACATFSINPVSGVIYSWSASNSISGTGNTACVNLYPSGGTITFTASYGGGSSCISTSTYTVLPCCTSTTGTTISNGSSSLYPPLLGGLNIYINGTFTINSNLTLQGCDVHMGPNARIDILQGYTFTLLTNQCNHVHACSSMWDGIYIEPGGKFISMPGNLIEDATSAVVSINNATQQGLYNCNETYFNKNTNGISVLPCPNTFGGILNNCLFTCRNLSSAISGVCIFPYPSSPASWIQSYPLATTIAGVRSSIGLQATSVNMISITGKNVFDNLDNGIVTGFSNSLIQNETFQHINANSTNEGAIVALGGIFSLPQNNITVGGSGGTNLFTDCTLGVYCQAAFSSIDIETNIFNFSLPATNTPPTTKAIWIEQTGFAGLDNLTIKSNKISDAFMGIECDANTDIHANIETNTIYGGNLQCSGGPLITGIAINETSSSNTTALYRVATNSISGLHYGIMASNVYGADIYSNTISLSKGTGSPCSTSVSVNGKAISLSGSNMSSVMTNTISTAYVNSLLQRFTGIDVSISPNSVICSNSITDMFVDINFSGACLPTQVTSNILTAPSSAFGTGIRINSGASIGNQGAGIHNPSENKFMGSFTCNTSNYGAPTTFYYSGAGIFDPSPASQQPGCHGVTKTHTIGFIIFPICKTKVTLPYAARMENPETVVTASSSQIVSAINGMEKYGVTNILTDNISLAGSNLQSGSKNNLSKDLGNDIKPFTGGYLKNRFGANDAAIKQRVNSLHKTADKCAFDIGVEVYEARAKLCLYEPFKVYEDACLNEDVEYRSQAAGEAPDMLQGEVSMNIYPNPNTGSFTIEYKADHMLEGKLVLYNAMGEKTGEYSLDVTLNEMNIMNPNLTNGVYSYHMYMNGKIVKTGKVVVIK